MFARSVGPVFHASPTQRTNFNIEDRCILTNLVDSAINRTSSYRMAVKRKSKHGYDGPESGQMVRIPPKRLC